MIARIDRRQPGATSPRKLQAVREGIRQGGGNRGATIKAPHVTSFEWWELDPHDELVEEGT